MKKVLSLVLVFVTAMLLVITASAEEFNGADLFTVDIPDGYNQTAASTSDFNFVSDDGTGFSVAYVDNTQEGKIFCPANMSKKQITEYVDGICAESTQVMAEYTDDFKMEVVSSEKKEHKDGSVALVTQFKTTVRIKEKEQVYFQKVYEFGGINYKYTFTYTTQTEDKNDDFQEVFDSVDIFEAYVRSRKESVAVYAIAAAMAVVIVLGIVRFIKTPEKRKNGKL